jgi:hypothetical protein
VSKGEEKELARACGGPSASGGVAVYVPKAREGALLEGLEGVVEEERGGQAPQKRHRRLTV